MKRQERLKLDFPPHRFIRSSDSEQLQNTLLFRDEKSSLYPLPRPSLMHQFDDDDELVDDDDDDDDGD